MNTSRQRSSWKISAAVVSAVAGLMTLVSCTEQGKEAPPLSTVGALKVKNLGSGEWTGPYARVDEAPVQARFSNCATLSFLHNHTRVDEQANAETVWADGEVAVRSYAYRFPVDSPSLDDMWANVETAKKCVREDPNSSVPEPWSYFRFHDIDDGVVFEESNQSAGVDWVIQMAVVRTKNSIVGVDVSYPVDTANPPVASKLLPEAVKASTKLTDSSK